MKALFLLTAACCCWPLQAASADIASALPMEARPLTYTTAGKVEGCGLRLTGGRAGMPASSWFDVSFNVFARGIGLAQSTAYELERSEYGESRPGRVPVRSTWLKAGAGSTRRGETIVRADALVYTLLVDDVLALFETVANARPVTLGIRPWGQPEDAVYTGTPVLDAAARDEFGACLARLELE